MSTSTVLTKPTIFGREPAIWIGIVQAIVAAVAMFVFPLTTEQSASIIAVVNAALGVLLAFQVRPIAPASITALLQAAFALLVGFGLELTTDQQGVLLTLAAVILNVVLVRPQVTPGGLDNSGVTVVDETGGVVSGPEGK